MAKFVVYKDKIGEWRWRFIANNGKIIADSGEGYKNKSECYDGINILREQIHSAKIEEENRD